MINNTEQQAAISFLKGPSLIIAGAGTGKTHVLTEKIKKVIAEKLARPEEILALTFTEKAAAEMEERVDVALPLGYFQTYILTFHSFADRILREYGLHIGISPSYKILTETEGISFFRSHLDQFAEFDIMESSSATWV
jgi:DNA helicase-2/ATP-dependent DNA helicase PcrA